MAGEVNKTRAVEVLSVCDGGKDVTPLANWKRRMFILIRYVYSTNLYSNFIYIFSFL